MRKFSDDHSRLVLGQLPTIFHFVILYLDFLVGALIYLENYIYDLTFVINLLARYNFFS